ncbi:MAG: DNA double-strand break repair nuclease NurA [Candidatus Thorarchaeota archaeon]
MVKELEHIEGSRARFGQVLRKIKTQIDLGHYRSIASSTIEHALVSRVDPTSLAGLRIVGIDGGLARRSFRAMDLIITRGIAVIFRFGPPEGPDVEFYPGPFPPPQVTPLMLTLSSTELDQMATLERIATELRVALSVLDQFEVDVILMDGGLFFHPRDRPPPSSPVYEKFQEVMALYRQLYLATRRKQVVLVGIVKDSRSTRIVNMLGEILPHVLRDPSVFKMMEGIDYRRLLKISRDCDLLDTFLDETERTFIFNYSSELMHATGGGQDDLQQWASDIWISYLRTARNDLPIRAEVLVDGDPVGQMERALRVVLPLARRHPEYGLPAPVLEADARARISSHEAQLIMDRLMAMSGLRHMLLGKRRSRNPFGG